MKPDPDLITFPRHCISFSLTYVEFCFPVVEVLAYTREGGPRNQLCLRPPSAPISIIVPHQNKKTHSIFIQNNSQSSSPILSLCARFTCKQRHMFHFSRRPPRFSCRAELPSSLPPNARSQASHNCHCAYRMKTCPMKVLSTTHMLSTSGYKREDARSGPPSSLVGLVERQQRATTQGSRRTGGDRGRGRRATDIRGLLFIVRSSSTKSRDKRVLEPAYLSL